MTVPRAVALARMSCVLHRNLLTNTTRKPLVFKQQVRHSGGGYEYRKFPEEDKQSKIVADALSGMFWWWILWHFFTDYHEFLFPVFPDPSKFTDEELGIPPA